MLCCSMKKIIKSGTIKSILIDNDCRNIILYYVVAAF